MSGNGSEEWITPTRGAKTLPSIEVLTGRGFITGKSGSGKSNTASVIAEELLEHNFNLLIVDPEGEYYGLKEKYELLHVGNSEICDVQVGSKHADKIAEIALTKNLPVILDVSDYLDGEEAKRLISDVVEELYRLEKDVRKPFLLMVEEMQEYLPQSGGRDDLAELLERVAKRGRKRGLGMLGMSQRPSSVDKDFITQCDWMVWHRLTWKNDLDVVKNILGNEKADQVEEFDTGEAFLMTDWDDAVERVVFKKKRTHDAGATPGLESYERPDLKSVGDELVAEFDNVGDSDTSTSTDSGSAPSTDANGSDDGAATAATPDGTKELEDAVEAVDSADDFDQSPTGDSTNGSPGGTRITYDEEIAEPHVSKDVEEMSLEEVRELARRLDRRNSILADEVTELRTILTEIGDDESDLDAVAAQLEAINLEQERRTDDETQPETLDPPTRPHPPDPPQQRSGLAGSLIEISGLIVYLFKSLTYRVRYGIFLLQSMVHQPQDSAEVGSGEEE